MKRSNVHGVELNYRRALPSDQRATVAGEGAVGGGGRGGGGTESNFSLTVHPEFRIYKTPNRASVALVPRDAYAYVLGPH